MTPAHLVDKLAILIAFGIPIALIWRWRIVGAIIGAFVQWVVLLAMGPILSALDPIRENGMLDAIWMILGLPFALAYSGVILLMVWMLRRPRVTSP